MNEIALQIIEIGKLIGKKVFITQNIDGDLCDITETPMLFTLEDFDFYSRAILYQVVELNKIVYRDNSGGYYLVILE